MLKTVLGTSLLLLLCVVTLAQKPHVITGTVRAAESNRPLQGATVTLNKSAVYVTTDEQGNFTLTAPGDKNVLSVSYVGRETMELQAKDGPVNALLSLSNKELDAVVTVAYTSVKRSGYPGAVATITSDKLEARQTPNLSNALQGLVPGLQTASSNGQPGNSSTLLVRGVGSINASSSPLIVVDGAPFDGDLNAFNAADIQSVSVLKDATAANLYGSRAANGVILITTKHGRKSDDVAINAIVTQGWSGRAIKDYDKLNTNDYFELYWEALRNKQLTNGLSAEQAAANASANIVSNLNINPYGSAYPQPVGTDGKIVAGAKPLWNDDWEKAMRRTGKYTQAQLSFSGGTDKSTYYVSGGYVNNDGAYIGSGFRRYNLRTNFTVQAKKWLRVGMDLSAASTLQNYPTSSDSKTSNIILYGRIMPGFYPIYQRNGDGSYVLDENGQKVYDFGAYRPSSALPKSNLIATLPMDKSDIKRENASVRSFAEISILPALKWKTTYNLDYVNGNTLYYTNPELGENAAIGGTISKSNTRTLSYTFNNIATYNQNFKGGHHLDLLAGQEYYSFTVSDLSGARQNFVLPGLYEPVAASQLNDFTGSSDYYNKLSFFGQSQYNFLNRYFVTASLRTDGSSRFSPQSRWGTFWSAGASWRIAEEAFLKPVHWLNVLTLKASYGASGNDNLTGYYNYLALYSISNNLGTGGTITSRLATPKLQWESNLNLNIGVDFGVLNNRISGTINYYNRTSKNLLYAQPMAPSTGYTSFSANIGKLRNNGVELELNAIPVKTAAFSWNINFNIAHNTNKITELPQKEIISGTKKLMVGKSIYDFYIRKWAGVDAKTGNPLWYVDGANGQTTTSTYANGSLYYAGSSLPTYIGGITNTFNYKGIELSVLFSYSLGGKVLDGDMPTLLTGGTSPGRSWSTELLKRWTPEHTATDVPRLTTDNLNWTSTSTRFLYNASYARLKVATLGYYLPKKMISGAGISSVKIYATGENLLTFFGHKGMDPEQSVGGTTYYQYPAMRTVSVGIQLGL
ncbi:TonB-linked outer membrane protein, SusC/RagA family [Filimonas lacunae]|uniref:TonB-linked outer membrane protein, SusC/RagA family n=1 Tax=Filimonas lacunae TaxID=477680 RepID=A0A173MAC8_9BACT|nr:TonB-dependent receptor [Filimonas lacunae]BAV04470.1 outer membrane protein, nutrient binding [Filimonas lacunae]SIT31514.1 TonB-linked outer membrane protein, SusC/RagA family [Filimonas lacunae]